MEGSTRIVAGLDVHKKMVAAVVARLTDKGLEYSEKLVGTMESELEALAAYLEAEGVTEVAMESTAYYWSPVWQALEARNKFTLILAQPRSTKAPRGRKSDFADARRIARRLLANDLTVSYVPNREQRGWRTMTRARVSMVEDQVRLRSKMEGLLEQCRIKLSGVLSDLLGVSGLRMLWAMAKGETDPAKLAELADRGVKAPAETLRESLRGQLGATERTLLRMWLEQWELLDKQIVELDKGLVEAMSKHAEVVNRLVEIPGVGLSAAEQIVAEVGPAAEVFEAPEKLASWVGVCPGTQESAGKNYSSGSPKGNWMMRRVLTQCAWAAVKAKGSIFQHKFQAMVPRLGKRSAIWAIAHRMLRIVWAVLHNKVSYIEKGSREADPKAEERRRKRYVKELNRLGFSVKLSPLSAPTPIPAPEPAVTG